MLTEFVGAVGYVVCMTGGKMTAEQILNTRDAAALFGSDLKKGFESLVKIWHPDRNKDPKAVTVFKHILAVRDGKLAALEEIAVPSGKIRVNNSTIEFVSVGDGERILAAVNSTSNPNFRKRVPCSISHAVDSVTFQRPSDTIMLPTLMKGYPSGLSPFHVAWVASRLYEHVMMQSATLRLLHGGIYADALLVSVADHGITPLDWRFNAPLGAKMRALPGPVASLAETTIADITTDLKSVNRVALTLLGDPVGIGNALLPRVGKDIPAKFFNWFRGAVDADPECQYRNYRTMLEAVFGPPKYHKLEVKR